MLIPALSLVSILSNYASAATVASYSATKCCCNGFSLKFVQEEQISRFTYECRTSHLFPVMSDGNCSEKNVKWEILRSNRLFGLKLHTDVSLLPPTQFSSTPPSCLPPHICDVCLSCLNAFSHRPPCLFCVSVVFLSIISFLILIPLLSKGNCFG